jgi:enamine deaminase RidA (YjgF/YER057c/UK114 family)
MQAEERSMDGQRQPNLPDQDALRSASATAPLVAVRAVSSQAFLVVRWVSAHDAVSAADLAYAQIAAALAEAGLETVHERVFGSLSVADAVLTTRSRALAAQGISPDTPVTYVEGHPPWGDGLAGVILHAVRHECTLGGVHTLLDAGLPCGRLWRCGDTTHLILQNIGGVAGGRNEAPAIQAARVIERANLQLCAHGLSYRDVVRTWFYISDIGDWYAEFNHARSAKYREYGLLPGPSDVTVRLPASTGIGARIRGAAVALDLMAVAGAAAGPAVMTSLRNPGQKDAFLYGSAFSRGALVRMPGLSMLQISGVAAIDEAGCSAYPGDVRAQIDCTLGKVEALLRQCGAEFSHVCAATAFVKHPSGAAYFWDSLRGRGLVNFPAVCVVGDICRNELLFELDAEAAIDAEGD